MTEAPGVAYRLRPPVENDELDELFAASWPDHQPPYDFVPELTHGLTYACAYCDQRLVGFARLAWDGGIHGFLLEPTVLPEFRRRGIGRKLVELIVNTARERGLHWVHVDFEPELRPFYDACGFRPTEAGLIRL